MAVEPTLAGRRALVTGAARGLGAAFARALAGAGAAVALTDRDAAVAEVADEIAGAGGEAWSSVLDVRHPDAVARVVPAAAEALEGLDLVVNNAAVVRITSPTEDDQEKALADFAASCDANLRGPYLVGRAAIPHLVSAGGGDIVNITTDHVSNCGHPVPHPHDDAPECTWAEQRRPLGGGPAFDVYDATKWGLHGLTHAWARGLAEHGIRVNLFGMGATDTPMYRGFLGDRPLPPGTMDPADVAGVLVDLVAEGPEGRTADDVQLWVGHPVALPAPGRV